VDVRGIHDAREVQFVVNESARCGSLVFINGSRRKEVVHIAQAQLIRRKQSTLATAAAMADEAPMGLSMRQIRFRFDGQPINETDTPSQLEMEDEDTIDVFQQQTGGSPL
uniref:Golgi associated, gamma adaptin ear containing, ARF binding protein 3a n=1 Tax=Oryzias sinensis TaxID=183150 RepID=A0A8C7XPU0_9TELE